MANPPSITNPALAETIAAALDRVHGEAINAVAREILRGVASVELTEAVKREVQRLVREDAEVREVLRARVLEVLAKKI